MSIDGSNNTSGDKPPSKPVPEQPREPIHLEREVVDHLEPVVDFLPSGAPLPPSPMALPSEQEKIAVQVPRSYAERLLEWYKSLPPHYGFGLIALWAVLTVTLGFAAVAYPTTFPRIAATVGFALCCGLALWIFDGLVPARPWLKSIFIVVAALGFIIWLGFINGLSIPFSDTDSLSANGRVSIAQRPMHSKHLSRKPAPIIKHEIPTPKPAPTVEPTPINTVPSERETTRPKHTSTPKPKLPPNMQPNMNRTGTISLSQQTTPQPSPQPTAAQAPVATAIVPSSADCTNPHVPEFILNGSSGPIPLAEGPPIPTADAAGYLLRMLSIQKSATGTQPVRLSVVVETKVGYVALPSNPIDWVAAMNELAHQGRLRVLSSVCSSGPKWWGVFPIFERFYSDYLLDITKV